MARDRLDGLPASDKAAWITVPVERWASESPRVTRAVGAGASGLGSGPTYSRYFKQIAKAVDLTRP